MAGRVGGQAAARVRDSLRNGERLPVPALVFNRQCLLKIVQQVPSGTRRKMQLGGNLGSRHPLALGKPKRNQTGALLGGIL